MATPPMLRPRGAAASPASTGPDPVAWLAVVLMTLVAIGLVVAGVLAVYDVATPPSLSPVLRALAVLFAATVVLLIAGATVRHARRIGR